MRWTNRGAISIRRWIRQMNARETLVLVLNACTLQFGDSRTQFMLIKLERGSR